MTHDELLAKVKDNPTTRAVVELNEPEQLTATFSVCSGCYEEESGPSEYPCPTIQAIEKELK